MRGVTAGLAAGLCTTAAVAQNLDLTIRVSADGGATWSSGLWALPGSTVQVGLWMGGDASIYGMGGATLRLTGYNAVAGDSIQFAPGTSTGRVAPFTFGSATNAIFRDTADTFRIDDASDVLNVNGGEGGMKFFQRDPATATPGTFSTQNAALVFRFNVTVSAESTPFRPITMVLDQLSRGVASYYTASNATRPATAAATLNSAFIYTEPTPSSGAALLLGVLAAGRRRCGAYSGSRS